MARRAPHFVLYDATCPLCRSQMRLLQRLDWRHAFAPVPLTDPRAARAAPHLPREQLLEAIHCVTARGRIYRGARCIRFIALRLPLLAPVALLLWIPGAISVAGWFYGIVSRNRHAL